MKSVYIVLILISLITIIMLSLTFFYLDQQRHQVFLYALYYDDVLSGYEKVDRYMLENSLIYKSSACMPRDVLGRRIERKIGFDARGKNFIDYTKEVSSSGAKSAVYISNGSKEISFLASGHANFSYLEGVPTHGNDIPFKGTSLATYPPLVRRYNFKKRGEQFVNVLIPISTFMPPVRDIVSITSLGKDVIEIEGRRIACERLALELKSGDLTSVWVTRTFHNVLMVNIPKDGFRAILCTERKEIPVEEHVIKSDLYIEREAAFTHDDIPLYGTFSVPTVGEAPYPAVLLIWDSGPMDRNALGIFTDIAHTLAEEGYCVLRFDKRGIGQSQGFFSAYAQAEEISDLKCAVDFLKSQPEVDNTRIAVLGHSEGGFYAAHLAGLDKDIRACIIMSALSSLSPPKNDYAKLKDFIKRVVPDDKTYQESAILTAEQNREIIKDKGDWITLLGHRVFTKKMAVEDKYDPLETIKRVEVPVLILHGRKDDINFAEEAKELGDALTGAGNDNFTIIYFGELGHFFGTLVKNPPVRDHIEVDTEVLGSITSWLDKNLLPPPVEPPTTEEVLETDEMPEGPDKVSADEILPEAPEQYPPETSAPDIKEEEVAPH